MLSQTGLVPPLHRDGECGRTAADSSIGHFDLLDDRLQKGDPLRLTGRSFAVGVRFLFHPLGMDP